MTTATQDLAVKQSCRLGRGALSTPASPLCSFLALTLIKLVSPKSALLEVKGQSTVPVKKTWLS